MLIDFERRCWAEINLDSIRENYRLISQLAGTAEIMAVVKANAYGHGDVACAIALQDAGARRFAVSGLAEAVHLRKFGITCPILVLGYTSPKHARTLQKHNIEQCVYSLEYAKQLSSAAKNANLQIQCHFKVDTGMGRIGFNQKLNTDTAFAEISEAYDFPGLVPVGIFTHFSSADSRKEEDVEYTVMQHGAFVEIKQRLEAAGKHFKFAHCCNSAALITQPSMRMDIVRPGIILYGCSPSAQLKFQGLKPAFSLKAVVSMVKEITAGSSVSYGRTFTAPHNMRVATLAAGYADGYPRLLSSSGVVSICGKPAKVLGRICMDQMLVDVSNIPEAALGSIATLFGGEAADSVDTMAEKCSTISYEILCNIGRRVQRVYIEDNEETRFADYLS